MSKNKHNRNYSYNPNMPKHDNIPTINNTETNEIDVEVLEDQVVEDIEEIVEEHEEVVDTEVVETVEMDIEVSESDIQEPLIETTENVCVPTNTLVCEYYVKADSDTEAVGCADWDSARDFANSQTKYHGVIHHVYNKNGEIVFSAKKKLTLLSNKKRGNRNVDWYS